MIFKRLTAANFFTHASTLDISSGLGLVDSKCHSALVSVILLGQSQIEVLIEKGGAVTSADPPQISTAIRGLLNLNLLSDGQ